MGLLPSCMPLHFMHVWYLWKPEKGIVTEITDGCEAPYGCWDLNEGPLEDKSLLLIAEPPLQSSLPNTYPHSQLHLMM